MPLSHFRRARRAPVAVRPSRPRRGFSVVEVIVAMVLLGISLSTLGVLAFTASRRNMTVANAAYRAAASRYLFDRYSALDFDALDPATQTIDSVVVDGPMPHRLKAVFLTTTTPNERRMLLIVTPQNPLILPETTTVRRFKWSDKNPLNMGV